MTKTEGGPRPMTDRVQYILGPNGEPEFVVLPIQDYVEMKAAGDVDEDAVDAAIAALVKQGLAAGTDELIDADLLRRIDAGENPIRVWREYRGYKASDLALWADISSGYLSQLETGKREGSLKIMARIARALEVDLELLVPPDDDEKVVHAPTEGVEFLLSESPRILRGLAAKKAKATQQIEPAEIIKMPGIIRGRTTENGKLVLGIRPQHKTKPTRKSAKDKKPA